jgi:hypothetical protein
VTNYFPRLLTILFCFFCGSIVLAEGPINLVVWVDDGQAQSRENFEAALTQYKKADPSSNYRVLYLYPDTVESNFEIPLTPGEKISVLTFATHGHTNVFTGTTELVYLGKITKKGTIGPITKIFKRLSSMVSKH